MSRRGGNRVNQLSENPDNSELEYQSWSDSAAWEENDESPENCGQFRDLTFESIPNSILYFTSFVTASFICLNVNKQDNDLDSDDSFYSSNSLIWDDKIYFSDSVNESGHLRDISLLIDNSSFSLRDISSDANFDQYYFADDDDSIFCDDEISNIFSSSEENIIFPHKFLVLQTLIN